MRLDHEARLERLLARHPDIALVPGICGNGTLIRRDQLLVASDHADEAHSRAQRWVTTRTDDELAGVSILRLRQEARIDVSDLAAELAGRPHRRINVTPHHVLTASPGWGAGPFDDPVPAAPIPAPHFPALPGESVPGRRTVTVAILDTGIAAHPWFEHRSWFGACGPNTYEAPDMNLDRRLDSVAGHGTFIAGVVLRHAPEANLLVEKVIAADGVTDELELLRGLAEAKATARRAGRPIDVISLSLGCYTHDDTPSPLLERAFHSFGRDTVVVACAGNAASNRPYWPAALKRVIAVASLDAAGHERASFSNYGWWVDACAIGDKVVSTFFHFDDHEPDGDLRFDGYATWSGTSFAAPRVAAAIAARAAQRDVSAAKAADELLDPSQQPSMPDLGVILDVAASAPGSANASAASAIPASRPAR